MTCNRFTCIKTVLSLNIYRNCHRRSPTSHRTAAVEIYIGFHFQEAESTNYFSGKLEVGVFSKSENQLQLLWLQQYLAISAKYIRCRMRGLFDGYYCTIQLNRYNTNLKKYIVKHFKWQNYQKCPYTQAN